MSTDGGRRNPPAGETDPAKPPLPSNLEVEQALLGAVLVNNEAYGRVSGFLRPEHFYEPVHREIYSVAGQMITVKKPVTPGTIRTFLPADLRIGDVTLPQYLARLAADATTVINAIDFARLIVDLAHRRELIGLGTDLIADATVTDRQVDIAPVVEQAAARLFEVGTEIAQLAGGQNEPDVDYHSVVAAAEARMSEGGHSVAGISTGLLSLDAKVPGLAAGDLVLLAGRPGMGKAQPLTARIRAATGWTTIGGLRVGETVASVDGTESTVTGFYRRGRREVFRLTFSDGRTTLACAEHLWAVRSSRWTIIKDRVLTTASLAAKLLTERYRRRISIGLPAGQDGPAANLPIEPYLLGALLGDGGLRHRVSITITDPTILAGVVASIPAGDALKHVAGPEYTVQKSPSKGRRGAPSITLRAIRSLGLFGKGSPEKFIPRRYLDANRAQREALLRGLLDTDGWAETFGVVRFSTSSAALAGDVQELVRSLGGWCSRRMKRAPTYRHKGERRLGRDAHIFAHILTIDVADRASLFSVPSKRSRALLRKAPPIRPMLVSVDSAGVTDTACITVSHPSHLYVTDDYVLTHNSALALNIARSAAGRGDGVVFDSLEMTQPQVRSRLLADHLERQGHRLSYTAIDRRLIQPGDVLPLRAAADSLEAMPLVIFDRGNRLDEIPGKIKEGRRRLARVGRELQLYVLDYLGLVRPTDRYRGDRVREVGEMSAALKTMAKQERLPFLVLQQLSRANEARKDKRPTLSDLRDSGSLEQDGDAVLFVYREAYYHERPGYTDETEAERDAALDRLGHEMEIIVAKQRQGPVGTVKVWCDVALNAVRDQQW